MSRQANAARNLGVLSRFDIDRYEITEYSVTEWETGHLHVKRTRQPLHVSNTAWHESYVVGPRGGLRCIYSEFY